MSETRHLFIFRLDGLRFAVSLASVERAIRAVAVTPLSVGTGKIVGVINLRGLIVPVINSRRMVGLAERAIEPGDLFVIVRTAERTLALVADAVEPVVELPWERITPTAALLPESLALTGIARLEDDLVLIHDLERCLSAEDMDIIARAISGAVSP